MYNLWTVLYAPRKLAAMTFNDKNTFNKVDIKPVAVVTIYVLGHKLFLDCCRICVISIIFGASAVKVSIAQNDQSLFCSGALCIFNWLWFFQWHSHIFMKYETIKLIEAEWRMYASVN